MNNLRMASGVASTSLAYSEPPVTPTPINRQPAPQPHVPVAAPVPAVTYAPPAASAAPVPTPMQPAVPVPPPAAPAVAQPPEPEPQQQQQDASVAIFLHLSSGERLWVGRFNSEEQALQRAQDIVRTLVRPEPGVWAKFGQRLIRPEAVVSIELANRRED